MTPLRAGAALLLLGVLAILLATYASSARLPVLVPLARADAALTANALRTIGVAVDRRGQELRHARGFGLEVTPNCTAWLHATIFLLGLALLPMSVRRRLAAGALGLGALLAANIARLTGLFLIGISIPQSFNVAHRYLGEGLLVLAVLVLWFWAAEESRRTSRRTS